jgi:hypothetical protein
VLTLDQPKGPRQGTGYLLERATSVEAGHDGKGLMVELSQVQSCTSVALDMLAQWAQQYREPFAFTPWPMILTPLVLAGRSKRVDRALEAVEHVESPRRRVFPETGLPEMPILGNPRV